MNAGLIDYSLEDLMTVPLKQPRWVAAIAIVGTILAGLLGLASVVFAFLTLNPMSFGVSALAAGLSFGLLANAVLRE